MYGKTQCGLGSLQRSPEGSEGNANANTKRQSRDRKEENRDEVTKVLRQRIEAVRKGFLTGGYCESEALKAEEKKIYAILEQDLAEAKERYGYSPDPKFKHPEIRRIELELNGLSYKPELVVKQD